MHGEHRVDRKKAQLAGTAQGLSLPHQHMEGQPEASVPKSCSTFTQVNLADKLLLLSWWKPSGPIAMTDGKLSASVPAGSTQGPQAADGQPRRPAMEIVP